MKRPSFSSIGKIAANLRSLQYQPIKPAAPITAEVSRPTKKIRKKKYDKEAVEERDDDFLLDDESIEDIRW